MRQLFQDKVLTKEVMAEEIKAELMYHFWVRSEYEVVIKEWIGKKAAIKVDIYQQLMLNWDRFIDYCWSQRDTCEEALCFLRHIRTQISTVRTVESRFTSRSTPQKTVVLSALIVPSTTIPTK